MASLCSDVLYFVFSLLFPTCGCLVSYRGVRQRCVCGLAMGPPTACPLALARVWNRAIGQLDQLRECIDLPDFGFDAN